MTANMTIGVASHHTYDIKARQFVCRRCGQSITAVCSKRKHFCDPCSTLNHKEGAVIINAAKRERTLAAREAQAAETCGTKCEHYGYCSTTFWACPGVRMQKAMEATV